MKSYYRWPFVSDFFDLAEYFKVHPCCSMYQYFILSVVECILLYGYIPHFVYLFISWWTFGLFLYWLLGVMLLWTFFCSLFYEHLFSFLLAIYLEVELLGHIVIVCVAFWGTARLFLKMTHSPFYILASNAKVPVSPVLTCYYLGFPLSFFLF